MEGFIFASFNGIKNKLINNGIKDANLLSQALISHPYHIATITGDAILTPPNNFIARIAFVDYDGSSAYNNYAVNPPKTEDEEQRFVARHASHMLSGVVALHNFVHHYSK